jgi:hypothetical protein
MRPTSAFRRTCTRAGRLSVGPGPVSHVYYRALPGSFESPLRVPGPTDTQVTTHPACLTTGAGRTAVAPPTTLLRRAPGAPATRERQHPRPLNTGSAHSGMSGRFALRFQIVVERVEPYDMGFEPISWEPNAPEAVFLTDDEGRGALAQRAHPDDSDQRCVVVRWDGVVYALVGPPNDEARSQHRLYAAGLQDVWLGVVRDSTLVDSMRHAWSRVGSDRHIRPLHYVVPSKECVVEVLAENVDVFRIAGNTGDAARASFRGGQWD